MALSDSGFEHHHGSRPQIRDGLADQPTGALVRDLIEEAREALSEGTRLIRSEVAVAKAEVRAEAKKLGPAAGLAAGGSVLLHTAVLMLAVTLGALLSLAMDAWLAFAITTLVFAGAGAALLLTARIRLRTVHLPPTNAIQNLEDDRQWAQELIRNGRSKLPQNA